MKKLQSLTHRDMLSFSFSIGQCYLEDTEGNITLGFSVGYTNAKTGRYDTTYVESLDDVYDWLKTYINANKAG